MSATHTDEMLERAASSALGILEAEEAKEFDRHLLTGCAICADALASFTTVASDLAHASEPIDAGPAVRKAVLARISAEYTLDQQPVLEAEGVHYARSTGIDWQPTGIESLEAKLLSRDSTRGLYTRLLRVGAGASIPAHIHTDVEELFVLEGDLVVNDVVMRTGDYCRADADSLHRISRSPNGCVFLVVSSERDKPLEEA